MEKLNYAYILMWIAIFIIFVAIIISANWNDIEPTDPTEPKIEQLREEYLNKYSKQIKEVQKDIQEVQKDIQEKKERKKQLQKDKKELWAQENQLRECLQANSMTGAVVDCDLNINNNKNE